MNSPTQPLQPFSPPTNVLAHIPAGSLSVGVIVMYFLYAVFVFWAIYTLIIIYHWLKYSHDSHIAFPSIATHLALSIALMAYALA